MDNQNNNEEKSPIESAKKLLFEDQKTRCEAMKVEIEELSKKYNCNIVPCVQIGEQWIDVAFILRGNVGFTIKAK